MSRKRWIEGLTGRIGKGVVAAFMFAGLALTSQQAHAISYPDMKIGGIWTGYDAGSSSFTGFGNAEKYLAGPGHTTDLTTYPYFDIFASISNSGSLLSGANVFYVYDEVDNFFGYTAGDHLYLSGKLTSVSHLMNDEVIDFFFTTTGGIYQAAYGSGGQITMGATGAGAGDFAQDFFNGGIGVADIYSTPVPEPSSVCLLLMGAGGLLAATRRRKGQDRI